MKHVIVKNNEKNEVMLIIVVSKKSQYKQLVKVLEKLYNENEFIKSVYISVKTEQNNVILGEDTKHIFGDEYLKEEMEGIKFNIYPDSFFQINKSQAIKLYDKAIEFLGESRNNTVIDAFSGTGTIAMALSSKVRKAIGIESVESSVNAARETAVENKIDNVEFINGKVEKVLPELLKNEKAEAIIFDPPRRGNR